MEGRCWMLDRRPMLDELVAGYWLQVKNRYWILDTGYWMKDGEPLLVEITDEVIRGV